MTDGGDDRPEAQEGSKADRSLLDSPRAKGVIKTAGLLEPLEEQLGDGIPLGSLTLVEGSASAGKSVLCQHFAYGALMGGNTVAYVTSEHSAMSFVAQMASIDLGVSDHLGAERIRICPLEKPDPDDDPADLLGKLASDIDHLTTKYKVIVVDALTDLADHGNESAIEGFFTSCQQLRVKGRAIIVAAHSSAFNEKMLDSLGSICDIHISLRAAKLGTKRVNTMEIVKARNEKLVNGNIFRLEVQPRVGMRLIPIPKDEA